MNRFERSTKMKAWWRSQDGQQRARFLSRMHAGDSPYRCERCGGFLDVQRICKKCHLS